MKEGMKRFFSEKEKDKLFLTSIKTSCSHLTFSTEGLSSLVCVSFNLGRKQPLKKKITFGETVWVLFTGARGYKLLLVLGTLQRMHCT